jgi:hypothetical protein
MMRLEIAILINLYRLCLIYTSFYHSSFLLLEFGLLQLVIVEFFIRLNLRVYQAGFLYKKIMIRLFRILGFLKFFKVF